MDKWFHKQSKLIQVLLLIIPVVNWFVEIIVRWSAVLRRANILNVVVAIIVTFGGLLVGWLDAIWVLLFNKLLCE
ncbi:MAG: hypothetical protein J1F61_00270 [Clostridiales bacterium]|nr:hypothetical protein [Clostridiales bacterium]